MRVQVINEVMTDDPKNTNKWELCLQWCLYVYGRGNSQYGYRYIWRKPDGSLQPARGQARIPSLQCALDLMKKAEKDGWGSLDADDF